MRATRRQEPPCAPAGEGGHAFYALSPPNMWWSLSFRRVAFRRRSPLLLLAAALTALAVLVAPGAQPAQAQDTTIWSATLNAVDLGSDRGDAVGCIDSKAVTRTPQSHRCNNAARLSDNSFTLGGTTYTVTGLYAYNGDLVFRVNPALPDAFVAANKLVVGTLVFPLKDATQTSGGPARNYSFKPDIQLNWAAGSQFLVTLHETPAVSFSGNAYGGAEGSPITITLRRTGNLHGALGVEVRANGTRHADMPDTADWERDYNIGDCPDPGEPDCHHGYGTLKAEFPAGAATVTYDITTLDDNIAEGDETFHLAIQTEDGGDYIAGGIPTATVTIVDDDAAGITVSADTLTVEEHDDLPSDKTSATYTLALDSEPESWVRITIRNSDPSRIRTYPKYVEFWPDHWDIPQTVTVNARFDYDAAEDIVTLSHFVQAADPQYQRMRANPVTVTMTDMDTAGVVLADNALNINIGATAGYGVRLDAAPTGASDVVVAAASGAPDKATVRPAALTFTADNWDGWQYFEVTGVAAGDAVISHTVSGSDETYASGVIVESVMVTVGAPRGEQPREEQSQEEQPQEQEPDQPQQFVEAPPGPVQNLRLTLRGKAGKNIRVEWDAPASGGAIKGYQVKLQKSGEDKAKVRRPGPKKEHVVFRNVQSGATYEVSVRAKNAAGKSEWTRARITLE